MGLVVSYPFEPSRNDTNHRAHRAAVVPSGAGVQKAPITGLILSIRARTASVTSVGESCLVRIFSASVTASMRQISFAEALRRLDAGQNRPPDRPS